MPLVKIETRKNRNPSQKKDIMDAVHSALRDALKIPEDDRDIRFREYHPDDFQVSPEKTENYILVQITLFSGRSLDAKRRLYQGIVANLGGLGIRPEDVFIVIHEVPLDNWGIRGGIPASEVDLGFKVDV
ncbi:MAG TPA: tautomerase family protein [Desulfobacteraceae bacterium]|nr:tautomerase family protein [Desulfobacteraceae bacterium]|tara:strand:- start:2103 stop:2492 length:390 start_codon:yes stop_codon:yes gene_type:complete